MQPLNNADPHLTCDHPTEPASTLKKLITTLFIEKLNKEDDGLINKHVLVFAFYMPDTVLCISHTLCHLILTGS